MNQTKTQFCGLPTSETASLRRHKLATQQNAACTNQQLYVMKPPPQVKTLTSLSCFLPLLCGLRFQWLNPNTELQHLIAKATEAWFAIGPGWDWTAPSKQAVILALFDNSRFHRHPGGCFQIRKKSHYVPFRRRRWPSCRWWCRARRRSCGPRRSTRRPTRQRGRRTCSLLPLPLPLLLTTTTQPWRGLHFTLDVIERAKEAKLTPAKETRWRATRIKNPASGWGWFSVQFEFPVSICFL